jgi:hypothetical protein
LTESQSEPKWTLTVLRYWRIDEVPPGFNSDEAVGAMGALTTLREGVRYSYEGQGGGGALGFYFAAAAFYLFGPSIATIRGLAAWAGVVSIFVNYWAVREVFRTTGLKRARWIAGLATLGLAVSLWHVSASRIAFAGIGVPFLMLPSVYFLWLGLNRNTRSTGRSSVLPFIISGIFLAGLMYIYLSGTFAPPFYALFFISQWLIVKITSKVGWRPNPPQAYLTSQFRYLVVAALTAAILLLPVLYVLFFSPELEPGTTRVSQAFFLNPQINQGDPWGLLRRSVLGNFEAYGISLTWLTLQAPRLALMQWQVGVLVFAGFLISVWYSLRGTAAYLFILLWFCTMLLPSILAPDQIPHNLRTIGATTPTYVFAASLIVWLFESLWTLGQRWLQPGLGQTGFKWVGRAVGLALGLGLILMLWPGNTQPLRRYFYVFPETNDAKAAYHVYAIEMAEEIIREPNGAAAFILPRNTAAGDVFRNFTTDFLTELEQPAAAHYWVIDDERTLPADLTTAAEEHDIMRVVQWKTSKHTGADPKEVLPYYLEKYGHYSHSDSFEYFNIHTYQLDRPAPNFLGAETLRPIDAHFGQQLRLTGYALGDAGDPNKVNLRQAGSNDLLWLRLAWQKSGVHPENLKVSALIYGEDGQLVTQIDKQLVSNILQSGTTQWEVSAEEETYFLISIPPATPPGGYTVRLAVYGADSLTRLPVETDSGQTASGLGRLVTLAEFEVKSARTPAKADDLDLALTVNQEIKSGLTLVGFETLPRETVRSREQVSASLIWQAGDRPVPARWTMSLTAKAEEGDEEWSLSEPVGLAGGGYQTDNWQPGELLRGWLTARVPPSFEPGLYKLRLRLATDNEPEQEVITVPIGDFQVDGWTRRFAQPQPQLVLNANYGQLATLVGLDADNVTLVPGDTFSTRLYWLAEDEFDRNYTVFVQLIGPDGLLHGQVDQTPGAGAFPTTGWLPGEYITDAYEVSLDPDAPSGDYQLAIGLYNPETGERLPVSGAGCQADACLVPGVTVK